MKQLLILFPFLLLSCSLWGQKELKTAKKLLNRGDFYGAVEEYEQAFKEEAFQGQPKSKQAEAYWGYAEACRQSFNFGKAESYYRKLSRMGEERAAYPSMDFYYAYTLKHNAKYSEAIVEFEAFLAKAVRGRELQALQERAKHELDACKFAEEIYKKPIEGVEVISLGEKVNTAYADFSPHLVGDELYFSALRFEQDAKRRMSAKASTKQYLYGKILRSRDRGQGNAAFVLGLNRKYTNVGNSALSADGQWLYYTLCERNPQNELECEIYKVPKKGNAWGKPAALPKSVNAPRGYTTTHPNHSFDSLQNKSLLFFASDRKGGFGGLDIWCVEVLGDNKYGKPFNLGPEINTKGNEATPFYHAKTQTLYFSSTWHLGLGGYDIFKAKREDDSWSAPQNVGVPLNSAANDLYFYIAPELDTFGYFSSNRPGSKILTGESCCNDIYALTLPVEIEPGDLIVEPELSPLDSLLAQDPVLTGIELEPEAPEAVPETPKKDSSLTPPVAVIDPIDPPVIELEELDSLPTEVVEEAPSIANLLEKLPISLYFHNDSPDKQTYATTTKMSYTESYQAYLQLQAQYEEEFSAQYDGAEVQQRAKARVAKFFEQEVAGEYARLQHFLGQLLRLLETGQAVEFHLRGYCSPRSSSAYNINLAKRRISSMRNEMEQFQNGAFQPYLRSGQLKFVELSIGETEVPAGVSDDINDPRNSIYSVEAAGQRKIQIEMIMAQLEEE